MSKIEITDEVSANIFADIHTACFDKGWNESTMRQLLLMPGALGLIAYEDENPVAVSLFGYSPEQADIITFAVLPNYRGKHISDELMKQSFDALSNQGIKELFLEVAVDNTHAISLYERSGFKTVGKRLNYYVKGDVKTDALVMKALL